MLIMNMLMQILLSVEWGVNFAFSASKRLLKCAGQMIFLAIFFCIILTLAFPQMIVLLIHDCIYPRSCPDVDFYTRSGYYRYLMDLVCENVKSILAPFWNYFEEIYLKFLFRNSIAGLLREAFWQTVTVGFRSMDLVDEAIFPDFFLGRAITRIIFDSRVVIHRGVVVVSFPKIS